MAVLWPLSCFLLLVDFSRSRRFSPHGSHFSFLIPLSLCLRTRCRLKLLGSGLRLLAASCPIRLTCTVHTLRAALFRTATRQLLIPCTSLALFTHFYRVTNTPRCLKQGLLSANGFSRYPPPCSTCCLRLHFSCGILDTSLYVAWCCFIFLSSSLTQVMVCS